MLTPVGATGLLDSTGVTFDHECVSYLGQSLWVSIFFYCPLSYLLIAFCKKSFISC